MSPRRIAFALLLAAAPLIADAENESIASTPVNPTSTDVIQFALTSLTHTDCDFPVLQSTTVSGNVINLVILLPEINSFAACNAVPTPFSAQTTVGPLAAGQYQLNWSYVGWLADTYPSYSRSLTVAAPGGVAASTPLPSSTFTGLALLGLLLGAFSIVALKLKTVR